MRLPPLRVRGNIRNGATGVPDTVAFNRGWLHAAAWQNPVGQRDIYWRKIVLRVLSQKKNHPRSSSLTLKRTLFDCFNLKSLNEISGDRPLKPHEASTKCISCAKKRTSFWGFGPHRTVTSGGALQVYQ